MSRTSLKLYSEFAEWFPWLSPIEEYQEEFFWIRGYLGSPTSALELGSGAGHLASHATDIDELVLTDISPEMLEVSKKANPNREHVVGDMRTLRLDREFDAVFVHDAIGYMTTVDDLRAAITTAAVHLRPGGVFLMQPDFIEETFEMRTEHGGHEHDDRALQYIEWDVERTDHEDGQGAVLRTHYALVVRDTDGTTQWVNEEHEFGIFPRAIWLQLLDEAGFDAQVYVDPWDREVFIGTKRAAKA